MAGRQESRNGHPNRIAETRKGESAETAAAWELATIDDRTQASRNFAFPPFRAFAIRLVPGFLASG